MTNEELLIDIEQACQQLRANLQPPVPRPSPVISSATELQALFERGGSGMLMDGVYAGNFVVRQPCTLTGSPSAILEPLDRLMPTLTVFAGNVELSGFTVENGAPDRECVVVGRLDATSVHEQPYDVVLDGLTVQAGISGGHRGIALHGTNLTVRNCQALGFYEVGRDSQAIWIHNGPGPYTIEDCTLEASGENLLVGGDTVHIPNCVPSDITIRRNTFSKPQAWRTNGATVKNLLELKNAQRVLIEDNEFRGCWRNGQDGTPILFTVRNQNGDTPWAIVDDVTFKNNRVYECKDAAAISILGEDNEYLSQRTQRITIEGNLFADTPYGVKIGNGVAFDLTIQRNTFAGITQNFLSFYDIAQAQPVRTPLKFQQNVVRSGQYGISSAEAAVGLPTVQLWTAGVFVFDGNVIELTKARTIIYPMGNTLIPAGELSAKLDPQTLTYLPGGAGYGL